MERVEKQIFKIFKWTALCCLGAIVLLGLIFSLFVPKIMFNITSGLGMQNTSYHFAKQQYKNTKNINDLHNIVNLAITMENNKGIVTWSEKLFNHTEFDNFTHFMDEQNYKYSDNSFKVNLANEEEYLYNQYIKALLKINKEEAIAFAKVKFYENSQYTFGQDKLFWTLYPLFLQEKNAINYAFLNEKNSDKTLINSIEQYVVDLKSVFDEKTVDFNNLDMRGVFELAVLRNKLQLITSNLVACKSVITFEINDAEYYENIFREVINANG